MLDDTYEQEFTAPPNYLFKAIKSTGIALYGSDFSSRVSIEVVLDDALGWFERFGCKPQTIGSDVFGTLSPFTYRRMISKFRERADRATEVCVKCMPPTMRTLRDGGADAYFEFEPEAVQLGFHSSLLSQRGTKLLEFAKKWAGPLGAVYGITFEIAEGRSPAGYGVGFACGGAGRSCQDWREVLQFGLYRYLRNVYRWNLLTDINLNARVGAERLEDWIRSGSNRGTLTPFIPGMQLWTVDKEDIPGIRKTLDEAGLFYEYERDLYSVIWKYRCSEEAAAEYLRTGKVPEYNAPDPNAPPLGMEDVVRELAGEGSQVLQVEEGGTVKDVTRKVGKKKRKP